MSSNYYKTYEDFVSKNKGLFIHHVAEYTKIPTGEHDCIIHFKDPSTSNGHMIFTYVGGYLNINGDYGDGSFTWYNPKNTLRWMANANFDYFMGKIQSGIHYEATGLMKDFNEDLCHEEVKNIIKENELDIDNSWKSHTNSYNEWISYLMDNGSSDFGDEWYEWAPNCGVHTHVRAFIWKYGFQSAVNKLIEDKTLTI